MEIPGGRDLPPPEAANWVHLVHQNNEVQMLIGYVDPLDVMRLTDSGAHKSGKEVSLRPVITRRISLSVTGYAYFRAQFNQLHERLLAKGLVEEAPDAPEGIASAD